MLAQGEQINGMYEIVRPIGSGGTGIIYLAIHRNLQKYVVLKQFHLPIQDRDYLRNEANVLKQLQHPALPQVYDFFLLDGAACTVIDFIEGQNLRQVIERGEYFETEQLVRCMLELAEVLNYLHSRQTPILHSDLKPENIILRPDGTICLIDFNIALIAGTSAALYGFSEHYASPEQRLLAQELSAHAAPTLTIDARSDIFSLGATFFYLLTGRRPDEFGFSPEALQILAPQYPEELRAIVAQAMQQDRDARYQSAKELLAAVRRYERRGEQFRRNCVLQALVIGICGILFCTGIWSLHYGITEKTYVEFMQQYQQVQLAAEQGEYQRAVSMGIQTLNQYKRENARSSQTWLQLLMAVADGTVSLSDEAQTVEVQQRQLVQAASLYQDATAFAVAENLPEATDCLVSWASLMIQTGQYDQIYTAEFTNQLNPKQGQVLQAMCYAGAGDEQAVESALQHLTESTRYGVYLALASVHWKQDEHDLRIYYLKLAYEQNPTQQICRRLAAAYMQAAPLMPSEHETLYYQSAEALYASLCGEDALFSDQINYAVSARASGDLANAKDMIDRLLTQYPQRFEVLAQAAMIYDRLGKKEQASQYASSALAMDSMPNQEQLRQILQGLAQ